MLCVKCIGLGPKVKFHQLDSICDFTNQRDSVQDISVRNGRFEYELLSSNNLVIKHLLAVYIQGGPKMAPFIVRLITSPNINRFAKFFNCQNQEIICNETVSTDLTTPQVCCCTTSWNVRWRTQATPATPLTGCVINVDRAWHVALKQPRLKSSWLCCSGCPSTDGLSMLTIHDSQPANESHCRRVGQRSAVVSLVNFLKCVVTKVVLFLIVILKTLTSHKVV